MNDDELTIFNRVAGFGVYKVEIETAYTSDNYKWEGVKVDVYIDPDAPKDFFFPDYAQMTLVEMAEVVANNLREELWNSLKP